MAGVEASSLRCGAVEERREGVLAGRDNGGDECRMMAVLRRRDFFDRGDEANAPELPMGKQKGRQAGRQAGRQVGR